MVLVAALAFYVGLPAVFAALLFRGGLVLLIAGVTYVRKDGQRASRLRLLWRSMVTWSPAFLAFIVSILASPSIGLGALAGPGFAAPAGACIGRIARARAARPPGRHLAGAPLTLSSLKADPSDLKI